MALFAKKAKNPADAGAAAPMPPAGAGADFASDVFGSDDAQVAASGGKKGRKAPKPAPTARALKNGSVVGLNIGNNLIKAVEVTAKNGEITVTGMGVMVTPPECYQNGNILSVSALSGALKSLWKQSGFKSKTAILSVAGTGSLVVRVIEVPKMTDSELSDNMKVDADRYIPFPPSEVIMDFKALRDLPSDPDAPNMEVLLAAAQREVIDLHVKVIQNSKLLPKAIDVEPIATARAIGLERTLAGREPDYNEVTALLNIGATGTEISVLRGDVIVFTRTLPNGGNSLTNAIAEAFGTSFQEAESQKIRAGNALAPAGYAATGDSFSGFDQNFGGESAAFADDVFGTPQSGGSSPFDDFGETSAAPASADPFDMDFFNQGPKNNEPGAGHSQKEGEPEAAPPDFNFSFDDDVSKMPSQSDPNAQSPNVVPEGDVVAPSPISFSFDANLPSQEETPPSTPSTPPQPTAAAPVTTPSATAGVIPSAFDFSDFDLPSIAQEETPGSQSSPASAQSGSSAQSPGESTFGFSETATIPAAQPAATPPASAPSFAFDTPAPPAEPEVTASPVESQTPTTEAVEADFGFTATPETAAVPQPISFGKEVPVPAPDPNPGVNMDDLTFGAPSSTAAGLSLDKGATSNDFDVDDLNLGGSTGGFDLDDTFGSDEVMDFGTGLGESVLDADAAALYGALAPALEELGAEVRRSLEYHLGRYPDTSFARIDLVGGGANLKNLDQFFTESLGVPTQVVNPLRFLPVQIPQKGQEEVETLVGGLGPACATALGLAVRDFVV